MGTFSLLRVSILFAIVLLILFSTKFFDRAIGRRMTGIGKIFLFVVLMGIGFAILHFVR